MATKKTKAVEPDYSFILDNGAVFDLYEREKGKGKNKQFYYSCKITLLDSFVIYGRVVEGKKGMFISYPSYENADGNYINLAYCFDKKVNDEIADCLADIFG